MKNCVSLLLLLAIAVCIGNAQVQRPNSPPAAQRPAPGQRPTNTQPQRPNAQQQPARPQAGQRPGATPQRPQAGQRPGATPKPQVGQRQPTAQRPAPNLPNRQQGNTNNRATRAPVSNTRAPTGLKPQQNQVVTPRGQTRAPIANPRTNTNSPVVQAPRPESNNGNPVINPRTTTTTTTRSPIVNAPSSQFPGEFPESFPTAPTIAPLPQIRPVTNSPNIPNERPNPPNIPNGRPNSRCQASAVPRNPILLAHETDCSRYYRCDSSGSSIEMVCPLGQHWNAARSMCDSPFNANCRSGGNNWIPQMPNWNQPPRNPSPGYEHPVVIPMAPRT